ncbi:hypothetical protein P167DRAFT_481337 [Morchella conica CCBAS932]|uniref:Amino acid permease/ SLC12A domain-containing protein n=1 Tax=Morchella conica CCBAS932 TaxID=1392247 RepID=A0A3N4L0T1_9PEZI|nr:hypothetical protein P167DRAFT_481337 [Morchella conica CCBAS932]
MSSNNKNEEAARDEAVSYVIDPVRAQEKAADDGDAAAPQLQRALDARHLQMLAIASSIGTGLFIGSGQALRTGGPLALVVSFTWLGAVLTTMMQCLCEMATLYPTSGSFVTYASRYIDPAWGFTIGIMYWACWIGAFGTEATAARILVGYWLPPDWSSSPGNAAILITVFNVIMVCIHICPVRVFGEIEFWVSSLKVISIVMFLIVIWVIMAGGGPEGQRHDGEYWVDPGALLNGFKGLSSVFVTAAFSCGGTEVAGIAGGETRQPRIAMPRAVRTLMFRIVFFYVVTILFLTFVVSASDPRLLGGSGGGSVDSSPFVIAISNAGIKVLPDILNVIVLLCVCSVGSVSIYTASRVLCNMSQIGLLGKYWGFEKVDRHGRPMRAILMTAVIAVGLSYLNCTSSAANAFEWFTSLSGIAFLTCWPTIIFANWRWRAGIKAQNINIFGQKYVYEALWRPVYPLFGFISLIFMLGCHIYVSASPITATPSAENFFRSCIGIPLILVLYFGYKATYGTRIVRSHVMNLWEDKISEDDFIDQEHRLDEYYRQTRWKRFLSYVRL